MNRAGFELNFFWTERLLTNLAMYKYGKRRTRARRGYGL